MGFPNEVALQFLVLEPLVLTSFEISTRFPLASSEIAALVRALATSLTSTTSRASQGFCKEVSMEHQVIMREAQHLELTSPASQLRTSSTEYELESCENVWEGLGPKIIEGQSVVRGRFNSLDNSHALCRGEGG